MLSQKQKNQLVMEISDVLIEFARDYEGMTTSDAQAVAETEAMKIVSEIEQLSKKKLRSVA